MPVARVRGGGTRGPQGLEPAFHLFGQRVGGGIHRGGGDGCVAVGQCPVVGGLVLRVAVDKLARQPVVGRVAPVGKVLPLVGPLPLGLAAHAHAFQFLVGGEVHVEARQGGQSVLQHLGHDVAHVGAAGREVGIGLVAAQREAYGGYALEAPLDDHTHRARVVDVGSRVVAVVDAAHYQVWFARQHGAEGQFHTVDRGSRALVCRQSYVFAHKAIVYRLVGGERAGRARPRPFGGHYYDFAQGAEELDEFADSFRDDAVVVRNQYQRSLVFHFFPYFCRKSNKRVSKPYGTLTYNND